MNSPGSSNVKRVDAPSGTAPVSPSSPPSAKPKITISFDDLHTPQVENRLRQQAALTGAIANHQRAAVTPSLLPMAGSERTSVWRGAFFNLFIFGLLGGLMAWGCGEAVQYLNPDLETQARQLEQSMLDIRFLGREGRVDAKRADRDIAFIKEQGRDNPWFQIAIDTKMSAEEKTARTSELRSRDTVRRTFADVCFYAACGMMIAISLGMAESVATRNWHGAVVYGGVGAVLGLIGGFVFALLANRLYHALGGGQSVDNTSLALQVAARSAGWGLLGVFLSAAPGVVMRNWRKLCLGMLGGLIGGVIGGALFDPVAQFTKDPMLSRFIAITAIGVITGVGTALVENVAKQGWLKVVQGLIAGKQFIVYRNPTFVGSSPACEVYLFKDPQVGARHAAIHAFELGYQLEDLGFGRTLVNGRPVRRARLRSGDRIQIGSTAFTFHERARKTD